jgi:hypothetical protein
MVATEASKDYIGGMRSAVRVPFAVFLAVVAVLSAGHALGSDVAPPPKPTATATPAKRLRLGPYVDPYGHVPVERLFDVPHFETRVEVHGKAMDSAALTARMEWWLRDFEPLRGAVPRQGSAPSLAEMRDHRPHVTEGVNIVPILDWLLDKLNGSKRPE